MPEAEYEDCRQYEGFKKDACEYWNEGVSDGDNYYGPRKVFRSINYLKESGDFGFTDDVSEEECKADHYWFWDDTKGEDGMCMTGEEANSVRHKLIEWDIMDENEILVDEDDLDGDDYGQFEHLQEEFLKEAVRMHNHKKVMWDMEDTVEDNYDGDHGPYEDLVSAYEGGLRVGIKGHGEFPEKVF